MVEQRWAEYEQQQETFDQNCEELCKRLRQADDRDLFDVLFPLACSSRLGPITGMSPTVAYRMPSFAANILFFIKPSCFLSCNEAIRVVSLSGWDIGLKEVPWYLAHIFDNDKMQQCLAALETEDHMQKVMAKRKAWYTAHAHQTNDVRRGMPPFDAWVSLNTVRYWLNIFVREQEDILKTWEPLWRKHRK